MVKLELPIRIIIIIVANDSFKTNKKTNKKTFS